MTSFRRHFGLDFIDVAVQVLVTGLAMGFIETMTPGGGREVEGMMMATAGFSAIVFAYRRRRALARGGAEAIGLTTGQMAAERLEELEARVAQLEAAEARVIELEERLDFTERMLARTTGERPSVSAGERG